MKVDGAGIISSWSDGTEISLYDLLKLMITESDNTATNIIIDRFDMDEINNSNFAHPKQACSNAWQGNVTY